MKKNMGLAICVSVLFGAMCPLAACTAPTPPAHEHTYAETWSWDGEGHWHAPTCGDTDEKKDYGAHNFGNSNLCAACGYEKENDPGEFPEIPPKPTYKPGETVTDSEMRGEIFTALREQEIAALSVAYDVNLIGSYNGKPFEYIESGESGSDLASSAESAPVFVKLAKNTLVYAEGEIVKTETGYAMTVENSAVLDRVLGDVYTAVAGLRKGVLPVGLANSIADLLWQPSMQNLLETMLYGISAEELTILLGEALPEDAMSVLPEATSDMSAFDYLWECLRSPELASALVELYFGDIEDSSSLATMISGGIASAPLEFVWNIFFQKSFVQSEVLADIEALREGLADGGQSGAIAVNFDEDYAITDLHMNLVFDDVSYESDAFSFTLDGTVYLEANA